MNDIEEKDVVRWLRNVTGSQGLMECKDGLMKLIDALKNNPNKYCAHEEVFEEVDGKLTRRTVKPYEMIVKFEPNKLKLD